MNARDAVLLSGQPRYRVVAQTLLREIENGQYPEGSMLPTENQLCERFSVSRHTIREAIRRLKDLGLITRRPGLGTRVISTSAKTRYVHSSDTINDLMQYVSEMRLHVNKVEEIDVDDDLSDLLEVDPGSKWTHITGLRYLFGENSPIAKADVYLPPQYQLSAQDLVDGSQPIYTLLEKRYGLRVVRIDQKLSAVMLTTSEAGMLRAKRQSAGLKVVRSYYADEDTLIEVAVSLHQGSRFNYFVSQHLELRDHGIKT